MQTKEVIKKWAELHFKEVGNIGTFYSPEDVSYGFDFKLINKEGRNIGLRIIESSKKEEILQHLQIVQQKFFDFKGLFNEVYFIFVSKNEAEKMKIKELFQKQELNEAMDKSKIKVTHYIGFIEDNSYKLML